MTNDFIRKGAQVLLYSVRRGGEDPYPQLTTVTKIFAKSFEVDALTYAKFRRDDLRSVGGLHYAVTPPDSEQAATVWRNHYLVKARGAALATVDHWNTGDRRDDLATLDAAIAALGHYRGLLAANLLMAETREG